MGIKATAQQFVDDVRSFTVDDDRHQIGWM
jgi:hypothetical protein